MCMQKMISVDRQQGQPTTIAKNRMVVATIPVPLKQPTPVLDKLMGFGCAKHVMLYAGQACYELSKKLFGLWWNTRVRHDRVFGSGSSFLQNVVGQARRCRA
jgi:hypothetical protein